MCGRRLVRSLTVRASVHDRSASGLRPDALHPIQELTYTGSRMTETALPYALYASDRSLAYA